jgi:glycerol-3-phosphate dehydrogenase
MPQDAARFSGVERQDWLEKSAESVADVLVVGGGITGAGVAREAALRGLSAVLVERGDFASGTSSRSSKLIHGGIRYLAQGDIALVREAARERSILRSIAPHLARPIGMLMPAPSKASRVKLNAGLWTFARIAGGGEHADYRALDSRSTREAEPQLRADCIRGGSVVFTEYATNDARLTLETLKSAASAGARVANYVEVESLRIDGTQVRATVTDRLRSSSFEIRAKVLVNAAGPWFDKVHALVDAASKTAMQLTRGIHLVVPRSVLPASHIVVLRAPDGRSTFVVPTDDFIYIGTTDTHYQGDAAEPGVSSEDARYLLDSVAGTFANAPSASDVVGAWAGVRPLLRQEGKKPSEISRRDEIRIGPGPVVSIAGGKLTTYRKMAERVVEAVVETLGGRAGAPPGASAERPLTGGSAEEQATARTTSKRTGDSRLDARLWGTYGLAASDIVGAVSADARKSDRVGGLEELTVAELEHAIDREMALCLDDVLRRRSRVGMFQIERACAAASDVAAAMASRLGWSAERAAAESERFTVARRAELAVVRGANPMTKEAAT